MFRLRVANLMTAMLCAGSGCIQISARTDFPEDFGEATAPKQGNAAMADPAVVRASHHPHAPGSTTEVLPIATDIIIEDPADQLLTGPQPLEIYIRRALHENRTVQAAFHNVQSLRHRIAQVTSLEDPVVSNSIFPIPSVAPQYSMMGYNPYNLTLAQQFPWFGTLRLRGEVAEQDVQVALAELAASQLDAVAAVKRAYYDLYVNERTVEIIAENRKILEDFRTLAKARLESGGTRQDVIRSEVLINELDREAALIEQGLATARAALARQLHVSPNSELGTLPFLPSATVPLVMDQLTQLAKIARPELQGRLAAVARDDKAVELAKKRFYPNVTLGLVYMNMERTNAMSKMNPDGMPNIGFFVGFNLPVYRDKYMAGVNEARERAIADAKLYEAQLDETLSEIRDYMVQAKVQQNVVSLLRDQILPRTAETLELARTDYVESNTDLATVFSALREVLQIRLQLAQVEGELGKALAMLERAVGAEINADQPPLAEPVQSPPSALPEPSTDEGPFRRSFPGETPLNSDTPRLP